MFKRLVYISFDFGKHMSRKNINAFASSTAFFLFLSLIPMLMLLCAIIPYTPITEAYMMEAVSEITPDAIDSIVINVIADVYDKSIGVISVTAVITLWSAGKGMLALMRGLNAINDVEEDRNYILQRIVASIYTVIILISMLLSLLLTVFGNFLVNVIEYYVPRSSYLFDLLFHFRILLMWAVVTVVIALLYANMPGQRLKFKAQLPGAVIAAVGWSAITWGFSVYVDKFNGFSTYGSLTTIIILMLWLYACMYIIMAGAFVNRYFKPAFQFLMGKKHIDKMKKID